MSGGGDKARGGWLLATLLYALLIAYGSLFPLTGWTEPADAWSWLQDLPGRRRLSWPDLVVNVLAYMPLGFGLARVLAAGPAALTVAAATVAGFGLSLSVEWTQTYLPSRVPAVSDLVTNTVGTGIGALLGVLAGGGTRAGQWLVRQRAQWIVPGRRGDVALMALGLWALSQLSPLVPSFDLGNLRQGVAPLWRTLTGVRAVQSGALLEYLFATAALALLAHGILREERRRWPPVLAALAVVLLLKIPVVGRDLSAEAVAGLAGGLMLAAGVARLQRPVVAVTGLVLLLAAIVTESLSPGTTALLTPFNWIPFKAHLANPLVGGQCHPGGLLERLCAGVVHAAGLARALGGAGAGRRRRPGPGRLGPGAGAGHRAGARRRRDDGGGGGARLVGGRRAAARHARVGRTGVAAGAVAAHPSSARASARAPALARGRGHGLRCPGAGRHGALGGDARAGRGQGRPAAGAQAAGP